MNKIITTSILDPSIQQPFTGNSLDFLQNASLETMLSLPAFASRSAYNSGNGVVLYGCQKQDLGAGNYKFYTGYVYYSGEIYLFDGINTIAIAGTPQFKITVTNDVVADPVEFTDGISRNVHNVRKVTMTDSAGDFNYSSCLFVGRIQETNSVSAVGTTTVESTVATITTYSACSYLNVSWNCWITESGTHDTTYKLKKNGVLIKEFRESVTTGERTISFTALSDCNYGDVFTVTVTHSAGSGQVNNGLLMIKN
jgi:hypothetical protein